MEKEKERKLPTRAKANYSVVEDQSFDKRD